MKELLTVPELAEFLKVSRAQVYNLINKGLPVFKVGSNTRFKINDVMDWLEEQNKKVN